MPHRPVAFSLALLAPLLLLWALNATPSYAQPAQQARPALDPTAVAEQWGWSR